MYFIGIDPGLTGGVGVLWESEFECVNDTPTLTVQAARGKRQEYDLGGMVKMLSAYADLYERGKQATHVFIEQAQAMPKQGVRSMYTTGLGMGVWLGILATLSLPYTRVRAAQWKRVLKLSSDKEEARLRAMQLFPSADLHRKKDHGRAEALLLAYYGLVETGQKGRRRAS